MSIKNIVPLLFFLSLLWACQKAPSPEILRGTWNEQTDETDKTKIIFFEGDSMYFFHGTSIDTLSYTLDSKHKEMFLTFIHNPGLGSSSCSVTYHKRKKILTFVGLLPPVGSQPTTSHYKQ